MKRIIISVTFLFGVITILFLYPIKIYAQWKLLKAFPGDTATCIAFSPSTNSTGQGKIFVGTRNEGVFLSSDTGESWAQINSGLTISNITALAVNAKSIFAGSYSYPGLYILTNEGTTWSAINFGVNFPIADVYSIVVSPDSNRQDSTGNGSNIYVANVGTSIIESTDNGNSWTIVDSSLFVYPAPPFDICQAENGKSYLFSETLYRGANVTFIVRLYLSTNNGKTWFEVDTGLDNIYILSFAYFQSSIGTSIYAGGENYYDNGTAPGGGGVFLMNDTTFSWTNIGLRDNKVYSLAVASNETNHLIDSMGMPAGQADIFPDLSKRKKVVEKSAEIA